MSQVLLAGAKGARRLCAFMLLTTLAACETFNPQPWDRDLMAKKVMQLNNNAVALGINDHIYFSKEGASGGRSTAGGGCGCN